MNKPLDTIVNKLNEKIARALEGRSTFAGSQFHGLAQRVRQTISETRVNFPAVPISDTGELKMITPTDFVPIETFHRSISVSATIVAGTGFGRNPGQVSNVFSMSLIGILNTQKATIDEVAAYLLIAGALTFTGASESFPFITVAVTGGNVNSDDVAAQEYTNFDLRLDHRTRLFRVSYSITTQHDPTCVPGCQ